MRLDDQWARRIGLVTLSGFLAGPVAGLVVMDRVPGWVAATVGFGVPVVSLLIAFVAMAAHQAGSGLSAEDLAAWQRRGEGSGPDPSGKGGPFLVFLPFVYLLAGPEQRRLARYERRTDRRRPR